jgi:hypothetical protein
MPNGNDEQLTTAYPAIWREQPPEDTAKFVALRWDAAVKDWLLTVVIFQSQFYEFITVPIIITAIVKTNILKRYVLEFLHL